MHRVSRHGYGVGSFGSWSRWLPHNTFDGSECGVIDMFSWHVRLQVLVAATRTRLRGLLMCCVWVFCYQVCSPFHLPLFLGPVFLATWLLQRAFAKSVTYISTHRMSRVQIGCPDYIVQITIDLQVTRLLTLQPVKFCTSNNLQTLPLAV